MLNQKRLAKRSLIGTRVAAPLDDGRYYCGCIETVNDRLTGHRTFTVLFDNGGSKEYTPEDIVGPGFKNISDVCLRPGQTVYITYGGREVRCSVLKLAKMSGDVLLLHDGAGEIACHMDDIHLLESRKAPRQSDGVAEAEHKPAAGVQLEYRKRVVTQGIDVPSKNRRRKHDDEDLSMDERMAALVLTSMSCSPTSPKFTGELARSPRSWTDTVKAGSPSPPMMMSQSAPTHYLGSPSTDEGIDIEDSQCQVDEVSAKKRKNTATPKATTYVCTWKGCGIVKNDCAAIERHVREAHLGPREDSDTSDHEEEFYYTELEVGEADVDSDSPAAAALTATALPLAVVPAGLTGAHLLPYDHDYQRKESKRESKERRSSTSGGSNSDLHTSPISIPLQPSAHFFPLNSPYGRSPKLSPASPGGMSPKALASSSPRKQRSEVKKCRKVYGMENRDLWCTQCKWKKACTRFHND